MLEEIQSTLVAGMFYNSGLFIECDVSNRSHISRYTFGTDALSFWCFDPSEFKEVALSSRSLTPFASRPGSLCFDVSTKNEFTEDPQTFVV